MEDLIDFRVSPMWRDYYYLKGLTPHPSDEFLAARIAQAGKDERLETLEQDNASLRKRLAALEAKLISPKTQATKPPTGKHPNIRPL